MSSPFPLSNVNLWNIVNNTQLETPMHRREENIIVSIKERECAM
jgi:hypothetical protein